MLAIRASFAASVISRSHAARSSGLGDISCVAHTSFFISLFVCLQLFCLCTCELLFAFPLTPEAFNLTGSVSCPLRFTRINQTYTHAIVPEELPHADILSVVALSLFWMHWTYPKKKMSTRVN
jgi:hypothetical protein